MHLDAARNFLNRCRLPYARLKRSGTMAMVAVCKAALLLAMLEAAGHTLESQAQACESLTLELANPLAVQVTASRSELAKNLAVRCLGKGSSSAGSSVVRAVPAARSDGHRLPNGLCAPMQC